MNLYIVVEGVAEKKIFPAWLKVLNPELKQVFSVSDVIENNYILISGNGFPSYYDYIDAAINTINSTKTFDRLIISIDSENLSKEDKQEEVDKFLLGKFCSAEICVIIQHFCIETWLLGNRKVGPRNPNSEELREFKEIFDVFSNDPELLPANSDKELNRAQFAFIYLKKMLREKRMNYSKSNPISVCHHRYLSEIKKRNEDTSHIKSFLNFLNAFNLDIS